tara:strand:- start:455 stop:1162 length:708 start_codon:yes stop_codon:yes gene_type:complete
MHKKITLITGASSGIGKFLAIELAKNNYEVILSSRSEDRLQDTANEIDRLNVPCHIISADLSDHHSIQDLYDQSASIGFVETVVNNAGFGKFDKIDDVSIEDWDTQMSVNLKAPFLITKLFSKSMIENKKGMLVYINSVAGKKAYPFSSAYVASKFALRGFSRSIREEFRGHGIKVVSVHPGAVDTGFWDKLNVDFPREEMMSSKNVAKSIAHCICSPDNLVVEEIDIQRIKGEF